MDGFRHHLDQRPLVLYDEVRSRIDLTVHEEEDRYVW